MSRKRVQRPFSGVDVAFYSLTLGVAIEDDTGAGGWIGQLAILANMAVSCFQVTGDLAFETLDCCIRAVKGWDYFLP